MAKNKIKGSSVPAGYVHYWKYGGGKWSEKKIRPGLWIFTYSSSKKKKSSSYGSFGKNTKGIWDIKARQYIKKTGKGSYDTKMIGFKKPVFFEVKRPGRKKNG